MQKLTISSPIDLSALQTLQRILLITDGTLTEILQAYFLEPILLVKLHERVFSLTDDLPSLHVSSGEAIIERHILLQGATTGRNYVFAASIIIVDRVDAHMKDDLLTSKTPLGRLWLEHRMETFKEIIDSGREPAHELASHFNIAPNDHILFRTYRVFSDHQPVILITEKFPETYPNA